MRTCILAIHGKTQGLFNFRESAELLRLSAFVVGPIDDGSLRSSLIKFNIDYAYIHIPIRILTCSCLLRTGIMEASFLDHKAKINQWPPSPRSSCGASDCRANQNPARPQFRGTKSTPPALAERYAKWRWRHEARGEARRKTRVRAFALLLAGCVNPGCVKVHMESNRLPT